jgi:hypothetical protein
MDHYDLKVSLPRAYAFILHFLQPTSQRNSGKFSKIHPALILVTVADNHRRQPLESHQPTTFANVQGDVAESLFLSQLILVWCLSSQSYASVGVLNFVLVDYYVQ